MTPERLQEIKKYVGTHNNDYIEGIIKPLIAALEKEWQQKEILQDVLVALRNDVETLMRRIK